MDTLYIYNLMKIRTKHISFKQLLVFGGLSIALECCKCARKISLRNSSGGPEFLRTLEGTLLTMQCKWRFRKRFILAALQRKCPMLRQQSQKNTTLAAIARYISITTIYTVGIYRFSTQGISFQVSIAMISKERSIGFPWFSTKTEIINLYLLSRQVAPKGAARGGAEGAQAPPQ